MLAMSASRQAAVETACGAQGWRVQTVPSGDGIAAVAITEYPRVKRLNPLDRVGFKSLKEKYLQYFVVRDDNAEMLRGVVKDLIDEGVSRGTLVKWAVEAGYSKGYAPTAWSSAM